MVNGIKWKSGGAGPPGGITSGPEGGEAVERSGVFNRNFNMEILLGKIHPRLGPAGLFC
jgi:hypothetical protein